MSRTAESRGGGNAIRALGFIYAVILTTYLFASPFLAAVAPYSQFTAAAPTPEGAGLLLSRLPLPDAMLGALRGVSVLREPVTFSFAYGGFLGISTVIWIAAVAVIYANRDNVSDSLVESVFRWSVLFALLLVFATPVQVHDFWLSVAWGRAVAGGVNPYYPNVTDVTGLPLLPAGRIPLMTYGPLWALTSGAIALVTGGAALPAAAIQKILIAAACVGSILIVRELVRNESATVRGAAVVLVGWAPLGLFGGIADGHNDVVFVFAMLVWLLMLERGNPFASAAALAASIAIKYVTAPLLAIHAARGLERGRERWRWIAAAGGALLAVALLVAVFYRSPDFFSPTTQMRANRFFTPASLIDHFARSIGVHAKWLLSAAELLTVGIAVSYAWRRLRDGGTGRFRAAALWVMLGILLGMVGHVWPWFVLWVLGLAAIQLQRRAAWFSIGIAAAAPFTLIPWTVAHQLDPVLRIILPEVVLYGTGLLALAVGSGARAYFRYRVSTPSPGEVTMTEPLEPAV